MMGELKEYVQPGIITILTALIGGLWWKRASNDVKSQNARNDRESRFEDNLLSDHGVGNLISRCRQHFMARHVQRLRVVVELSGLYVVA